MVMRSNQSTQIVRHGNEFFVDRWVGDGWKNHSVHRSYDDALRAQESLRVDLMRNDASVGTDVGIGRYVPPSGKVYEDWNASGKAPTNPHFRPTERQMAIMNAVERAIDSGLFYNNEVNEAVARLMGYEGPVSSDTDFAYDVYNARKAIEAKRRYAKLHSIASEMRLAVGQNLGTLIFNDAKITSSVCVLSVFEHDPTTVEVVGVRGASRIRLTVAVDAIKHAIERAHQAGKRKTSYEEFVAQQSSYAEFESGERDLFEPARER